MKRLTFSAYVLTACFVVGIAPYVLGQNMTTFHRPYDQAGVNMFEAPQNDDYGFDGVEVRVGGAFAQQFQALDHENSNPLNLPGNELIALSSGFNLATANLNLDVLLAEGVSLNLITYLSSRHHPEAWVKGGYIIFDQLPFLNSEAIDNLMDNIKIKVGHMEINYGDGHFRRTDNGNAMHNPFVGNYVVDAFNTEIGAEFYYYKNNFIGMLGVTGGEIKGDVTEVPENPADDNAKRSPAIIGKLAYDKQVDESMRFRVSGSIYYTASSRSLQLYTGDRGGSRYYLVVEPVGASTGSNFRSGRWNPNYGDEVTSIMGNVFFKTGGLEIFGLFETASGYNSTEDRDNDARVMTQIAGELIYRFGADEDFYFGGRYNTVTDDIAQGGPEITIDRIQIGAGWFLTDNILMKAEYVNQNYNDFDETSIYHEASFNGLMIEAVVGF